jgi:hypothetical protein
VLAKPLTSMLSICIEHASLKNYFQPIILKTI